MLRLDLSVLPLSILGPTGADEVLSSVRIDHHQISETWSRALAFAVRTTPIQQFGIGFGVGW